MTGAGYSRGEVAFLLSLDHQQAIEHASGIKDSIGKLTEERGPGGPGFSPDGSDVPFIAAWAEVDLAKKRLRAHKTHVAALQLRLQGFTDEEVAAKLGISRRTAGRRWQATLAEILELLGGEADPTPLALDHIDACLKCAENPRGRVRTRARIWNENAKRWQWKYVERPSSMCMGCLAEAAERGATLARNGASAA